MKSKKRVQVILIVVLMLTLSSFKSVKNMLVNQDAKTIIAIYDGAEEYGYNFIFTNDDEDERTITFQNIKETVSSSFDLQSESLIGTTFKVTYTTVIETEEDEDGFETETEILTITTLESVK